MNPFTLLIVAITIVNSGACVAQSASNPSVEIQLMVAHANAERSALFSALKESKPYVPKSQIGEMLLNAKAAETGIKGWEEGILKTLPNSDVQMEAFLEFTHASENASIEPLFRTYYSKVFEAASRCTDNLHAVFVIATQFETTNWFDYDDSDWFCDQLGLLNSRNPHKFQAALQAEPAGRRAYLATCGKHTPLQTK